MNKPLQVLILKGDVVKHDDGFKQAFVDALRRAGMVIEEVDLNCDAGALLDRVEKNVLTIVLKPC